MVPPFGKPPCILWSTAESGLAVPVVGLSARLLGREFDCCMKIKSNWPEQMGTIGTSLFCPWRWWNSTLYTSECSTHSMMRNFSRFAATMQRSHEKQHQVESSWINIKSTWIILNLLHFAPSFSLTPQTPRLNCAVNSHFSATFRPSGACSEPVLSQGI